MIGAGSPIRPSVAVADEWVFVNITLEYAQVWRRFGLRNGENALRRVVNCTRLKKNAFVRYEVNISAGSEAVYGFLFQTKRMRGP